MKTTKSTVSRPNPFLIKVDKYVDTSSAEKTLSNLFGSKMIGKEIHYAQIEDNPEDDPNLDILTRTYEVLLNFIFRVL